MKKRHVRSPLCKSMFGRLSSCGENNFSFYVYHMTFHRIFRCWLLFCVDVLTPTALEPLKMIFVTWLYGRISKLPRSCRRDGDKNATALESLTPSRIKNWYSPHPSRCAPLKSRLRWLRLEHAFRNVSSKLDPNLMRNEIWTGPVFEWCDDREKKVLFSVRV